MTEEYCTCGHEKSNHRWYAQTDVSGILYKEMCAGCYQSFGEETSWHFFKLDNLKYVEDLAAEKGLV